MSLNWDHQMLTLSVTDIVTELARTSNPDYKQQLLDEYFWLSRQAKLQVDAIAAGWEKFDWDKAHELGWFCPADYTHFTQLEKYKESALKNHPHLLQQEADKSALAAFEKGKFLNTPESVTQAAIKKLRDKKIDSAVSKAINKIDFNKPLDMVIRFSILAGIAIIVVYEYWIFFIYKA